MHVEHNTSLAAQKGVVLQMFAAAICSGMTCKLASVVTGSSHKIVHCQYVCVLVCQYVCVLVCQDICVVSLSANENITPSNSNVPPS